jgi:hypothetical protein
VTARHKVSLHQTFTGCVRLLDASCHRQSAQSGLRGLALIRPSSLVENRGVPKEPPRAVPKIEIAAAALPVVLELVGLLEDLHDDKKAAKARRERREQLQEDVTRIANDAADQALAGWKPHVGATREALHEIAGLGADRSFCAEGTGGACTGPRSRRAADRGTGHFGVSRAP